jgi:hypothetical protein
MKKIPRFFKVCLLCWCLALIFIPFSYLALGRLPFSLEILAMVNGIGVGLVLGSFAAIFFGFIFPKHPKGRYVTLAIVTTGYFTYWWFYYL